MAERPQVNDAIELSSSAFADRALIPEHFALDGGNASPPLTWERVPAGTAELELVCEDPDAPRGTFVHWVVSGIPPTTTGIGENGLPVGATAGRNDFGRSGWAGPRPPKGDRAHRYVFTLFAADQPLGLKAGATARDLLAALRGHELASGTLVGRFAR
ncbi:Raf kinase inhibitor-like YbhB/YbcL family protein [Nocardia sp. GAS34]|uniref:YbhB/YbcL family Raf kinase inhibitor-like protein n=1 Tax=unclassified Nocardia TaxID=2637762 RepID=UPI003D24A2B9